MASVQLSWVLILLVWSWKSACDGPHQQEGERLVMSLVRLSPIHRLDQKIDGEEILVSFDFLSVNAGPNMTIS